MLMTTGCQNAAQRKQLHVYPVYATKVKIKDDGSFEVTGKTKAPTDSIVMAEYQYPASREKDVNKAYPSDAADYKKIAYPKVRRHKFTVILNANNELKAGQIVNVKMFAVAGYGKLLDPSSFGVDKVPAKIAHAAQNTKIKPIKIKVTPAVIKRYPTVPIT